MAIIRWRNGDPDTGEPFDILKDVNMPAGFELDSIDEEHASIFRDAKLHGSRSKRDMPDIEVTEDEDNFYLLCKLPFVDVHSLKINIHRDILRITGNLSMESVREDSFKGMGGETFGMTLSLRIMRTIDKRNVRALFRDGTLRIILPKKKEFQA